MAVFLSPEWLAQLDAATQQSDALASATSDVTLTIEQVVRGTPDGEVRYHVAIERGDVRVRRGAADAPDLTFAADYDVARALARGDANAQDMLVGRQFTLTGKVKRLVAYGSAIDALDDVFATVRSETTYPDTD